MGDRTPEWEWKSIDSSGRESAKILVGDRARGGRLRDQYININYLITILIKCFLEKCIILFKLNSYFFLRLFILVKNYVFRFLMTDGVSTLNIENFIKINMYLKKLTTIMTKSSYSNA